MRLLFFLYLFLAVVENTIAQVGTSKPFEQGYKNLTYQQLLQDFNHPPESAKPWVFWYWMHASVSKEGITADLEAMKYAGIGGAYLMPIKDTSSRIDFQPDARQLSPEWWALVKYACSEADRLGLKIGMHVSDGFALAGGPWITPGLSMQKLVWTQIQVEGSQPYGAVLPQPLIKENYYRDIAVFAYPAMPGDDVSTNVIKPVISTNKNIDAGFLADTANQKNFSSEDSCWIQYAFEKPFTCRSIVIRTNGNNYQAQRLMLEISNDGINFQKAGRMQAPRHGWQDTDENVTHSIVPVTAKYFRFIYHKAGSEPGAEDLDAAKWKQSLKIKGIELSSAARINQFESKNGSIWRISKETTAEQVPGGACIDTAKIINITKHLSSDGKLTWQVPQGKWTIIRMGHTSTGHTNATGGAGKGLECDKFNPAAIKLQFESWFGEAVKQVGPSLTPKVLNTFHIDSWECGSQNWSPLFREAFLKKRGYDIVDYLPVMAGIPIGSIDKSERILHDVRQTITELVVDVFYETMGKLAREKGCVFSAESVAPTMMSDGMLHYKKVDLPMGEFWLRSPTHDKPNDMLDAISGAHIYGKRIIQAESFTELKMAWDEHPGMLKIIQDRNYALGINKLVYHVFAHNPWMNKKPGMTLDGVGLYFQRDQTWWKPGKQWISYAQRCQALLQTGRPVADIAVFAGEELPLRSLLPDRLVSTLPGIFGDDIVQQETIRLANKNEPLTEQPAGVRHSANMTDPADWIDPLQGYAYDCFNPDALLSATVQNHDIVFKGGSRYKLLVLPQPHAMSPSGTMMSVAVAQKLLHLVKDGATLLLNNKPLKSSAFFHAATKDSSLREIVTELWRYSDKNEATNTFYNIGNGRIIYGPFTGGSFDKLFIYKDVKAEEQGVSAKGIAWTHRTAPGMDIYFISNQLDKARKINFSLRVKDRMPELWDAVTGTIKQAEEWKISNGRTHVPISLAANGSVFIVMAKPVMRQQQNPGEYLKKIETKYLLDTSWQVQFDPAFAGPHLPVTFHGLTQWNNNYDTAIRYYSGTAIYTQTFESNGYEGMKQVSIDLGNVANIASVFLNGMDCGTIWTAPYRALISNAIRKGKNTLQIAVTNTWANRLIGDQRLPLENQLTETTSPIKLAGKPLLPAGLLGPVTIITIK